MIFVLDTNVLSERTKPRPDPGVEDFLRRVPTENVRVNAIALGEIAQGVENRPTPELKRFLREVWEVAIASTDSRDSRRTWLDDSNAQQQRFHSSGSQGVQSLDRTALKA